MIDILLHISGMDRNVPVFFPLFFSLISSATTMFTPTFHLTVVKFLITFCLFAFSYEVQVYCL